jgi:hypothetical protein
VDAADIVGLGENLTESAIENLPLFHKHRGVFKQSSSHSAFLEMGGRLHALLDDSLAAAVQKGDASRLRPIFVPATNASAHPPLSLSSILKPFEKSLTPPFVRFTRDAGTPLDAADLPTSLEEVVNNLLHSDKRRSVVLRLEQLFERGEHGSKSSDGSRFNTSSLLGPLYDVLAPFLPLSSRKGGTTGHVYISNGDASALKNHTDVTEILVLQLLGQKEWLHCTAEENDFAEHDSQPPPEWLTPKKKLAPAKLSKCTTFPTPKTQKRLRLRPTR